MRLRLLYLTVKFKGTVLLNDPLPPVQGGGKTCRGLTFSLSGGSPSPSGLVALLMARWAPWGGVRVPVPKKLSNLVLDPGDRRQACN